MSRVGVIADAHANLPAMIAVLDALDAKGCASVVHVGDAIGIGPHPCEVLTLLVDRKVTCVLGNHDCWFAFGIPPRWKAMMSAGEVEHQLWTHAQLSEAHREAVRAWPYEAAMRVGAKQIVFVHYARRADGEFDFVRDPSPADFGRLYRSLAADLVVFGHDHRPFDVVFAGRRFLSPGSLGCHDRPEARALVLAGTASGEVVVEKIHVPYADDDLLADFDRRHVPERDFIRRTFITRT